MIVNISSVKNDMKYTHIIKRLSIILGIEHRLPTFGLNVTCKQGQKLCIRKYVKVLIRSDILKVRRSRNLSMIHKWFYVTLKVVLSFKKILCFHNVSFQRNFYQNRLIKECAWKNSAKRALCDLQFYEKFEYS